MWLPNPITYFANPAEEEIAYWSSRSPEELREHALFVGEAFHRSIPDDFVFRFDPAYPVSRLLRCYGCFGLSSVVEWWKEELAIFDAQYLRELQDAYVRNVWNFEPIVVAEFDRAEIGDGWHRVAIALMHGMKTLPAIVGRAP